MAKIIKFLIKLIIGLTAPGFVFDVLLHEVAAHSDTKSNRVVSLIIKNHNLICNNYNSFIGYQPRDDLVMIVAM